MLFVRGRGVAADDLPMTLVGLSVLTVVPPEPGLQFDTTSAWCVELALDVVDDVEDTTPIGQDDEGSISTPDNEIDMSPGEKHILDKSSLDIASF